MTNQPPTPINQTIQGLDGSFKAMAVSLPAGTELLDAIPEADPTLIHEVGRALGALWG